MKTVKPQRLSVLHRTFENDRRCYFVPTILVYFPFESPDVPLHEVHLWKAVGEDLGGEAALDECMWKTRGEVLLTARAYPRGGGKPACAVKLELGPISKELYVVGDRRWVRGGVASDPEPFTEMPVSWSRAFGGEGYDKNDRGRGFAPTRDEETGETIHRLPNVEHPKRLVRSPGDRPEPVGFGALDITRPERMKKRGTYDNAWLEKRFPGFPEDIDWTFFNVAPSDQWIEGYFDGGEPFELTHMHPSEAIVASRLPRLRPRCFITREGGGELEEIALRFDTVHLFPHRKRGIALYRGVVEVLEDDASDVSVLLAACEATGDPRPLSHYTKVLAQRLDPEKGYLYILRDSDLMPERDPEAPPIDHEALELEPHASLEFPMAANMRRRMERELEKARALVIEAGLDPEAVGVPDELPAAEEQPKLEELAEYVEAKLALAEEQRLEAMKKKDEMLAEARAACEELGLDFDAILAAEERKQGGPPKMTAVAELEKLRDQAELGRNAGIPLVAVEEKLADPTLWEKLREAEAALVFAYRRFAHHFPAASRLERDEASRLRAEVERAAGAGESLAGRDLTGADLSGLDLRGLDLGGAFLEAANLAGTILDGANLEDAVLTRADLTKASLAGARVRSANFGRAILHGTDLSGGIDLEDAVFGHAELVGANLENARIDGVDLMEARLSDCRLSGITGDGVLFYDTDLSSVDLSGARLTKCLFFRVDVRGTVFSGACLNESSFVTARGEGAKLDGIEGINLRVVERSSFAGASFQGANLERACLRGTDLSGADLSEAELGGADVSGCNLEEAQLVRARATKALAIKANLSRANLTGIDLREAIVSKANLRGADFRGANLFRADFARIHGDRGTRFDGANMKRIRFVARSDGKA